MNPLARRDPGTTQRAYEAQDRARALGLRLRYRRERADWLLVEPDGTPVLRSEWMSEIEAELARREVSDDHD